MSVLGLDLSRTCGWAWGPPEAGSPALWGHWQLANTGGEGARFAGLANELYDFLGSHPTQKMVLEAPLSFRAQTAEASTRQQYGLRAIAIREAYEASVGVAEVDVNTVRREVMGIGRISRDRAKPLVVAFCRKRGIRVHNHHQADAVMVWLWHARRVNGIAPMPGPLFWEEAA